MKSRYLYALRTDLLLGDVVFDRRLGNRSHASNVIAPRPQSWESAPQPGKLLAENLRRTAFELCCKMRWSQPEVRLDEEMNMVRPDFQSVNRGSEFRSFFLQESAKSFLDRPGQHRLAVLRAPEKVILQGEDHPSRDTLACVDHANSLAQKYDICDKHNAP